MMSQATQSGGSFHVARRFSERFLAWREAIERVNRSRLNQLAEAAPYERQITAKSHRPGLTPCQELLQLSHCLVANTFTKPPQPEMNFHPLKQRYITVLAIFLALAASAVAGVSDPLKNLKPTHPRVLVEAGHWAQIKAQAETDPLLAQYIAHLLLEADQLLEEPPLERKKQGRRLLHVSREALHRISIWSVARHLTGELRYAERTEKEMRQLVQFSDWNPSHFLDVAEMTAALAIGYDWLYDDLDAEARKLIRDGLIRHGLQVGVEHIRNGAWWATRDINWNQVCLGGLSMGAVAVADEAPALAAELLNAARSGIPNGLSVYAPDGVYPEGPGYWSYGTVYQCMMIDALRSALDTSWAMEETPGFLQSARTQVQLAGPTGRFFNFADGREGPSLQVPLFWFARELKDPSLLHQQREILAAMLEEGSSRSPGVLPVIWWPEGSSTITPPSLPLAWIGNGAHPVAVFRGSWSDPGALYLACKGGLADISHAHMDAGSFVLEANGVRWAVDLGMQGYHSLEAQGIELWDRSQQGNRWDVFRLNNRSHNTLTINNKLHRVDGAAHFTHFDQHNARLDLSPVFKGEVDQVTRSFEVAGREVIITDHLKGLEPGAKVRWTMATRAKVEVDGRQATLRQDGERLKASLREESDGHLRSTPADPPADGFNAPNPGTSLLIVEATATASGELKIEMHFKPD